MLTTCKPRADLYKGLSDAVTAGEVDTSVVGRKFILPSSFTGGPRNIIQHYQDAMAICQVKGAPNLFIIFTCNPNWIEIRSELATFGEQRPEDRPDIVARVFHIKFKHLQSDLTKKNIFGGVIAGTFIISRF